MSNFRLTKSFQSSYGKIKYDVKGEGKALVLVHGTPWSAYNYRHLIDALSDWYKVYYYDLIGYGQSEKIETDVSLGIQNEVLNELLRHLDVSKPIIIGHDFGGGTALRTHIVNQIDFEKIVLIDPVAIGEWGSPFFRHIANYEEAFQGLPDYIHENLVTTYVKSALYNPLDENIIKSIVSYWCNEKGKKAFYRQIAQSDMKYTKEIEAQYKDMNVPTLILWGEIDEWIPVEKAHQLNESIPNSILHIIPDSGHLVLEEKPTQIFSHILAFLIK
ncbi:alpha/beta fold hydrolase [Gracilibacillus dipsosauri]|uniref:Alpha/beta hydrolase n=1 Tax=Gracilibacillus dipsosauri TaxID=178340 RepID=A0A317L006_9BACI|nr:alpha/beta hydrolase [Gracilibacillus dipsosauri]PWU68806.1 alpha/beta hydrolase [Gracilibacillus dipsosauri]